jgi:hypothetical protein
MLSTTSEHGAAEARGCVPRADHSRLAHAAGRCARGHVVRAGRAPGADVVARQRVLDRGAGRVGGAGLPWARRTGRRLRLRAEDRRSGVRAHLRAGPAGPRRDARRRARRRGHHRQRPYRRRGAASARARRSAGGRRDPWRDVPAGEGLRSAQRAAAGGRPEGVRQPAQLGGRVASPEEPDVTAARPCVWVHSFGAAEGVAGSHHAPRGPLRRTAGSADDRAEGLDRRGRGVLEHGGPGIRSTGRSTAP